LNQNSNIHFLSGVSGAEISCITIHVLLIQGNNSKAFNVRRILSHYIKLYIKILCTMEESLGTWKWYAEIGS
jgi:hypothetical protein